ncbi:MAG: hypothetical protein NT080_05640 [Spirochaetes bacterium]|nr:hypothetical protein [Spirochaetota bacterium]
MNDLERFRYFKLPLPLRLILTLGLYVCGVLVQIGWEGGFLPGCVLIVLGWFPIKLKRITNKPKDQGREDWRAVGSVEVDKLLDTMKESKLLRKKLGRRTGVRVLFVVAVCAAMIACVMAESVRGMLAAFDLFLMAFPAVFLGGVTVFVPGELDMKLQAFLPILGAEPRPDGVIGVPYLRFDQDENGLDIPEDVRCMLELRRPPADFVGIQFQAAINNGENGAVPYIYAVVLTRGKEGPAWNAISRMKASGFVVEKGGDDKYGSLVVRQNTEGGGYHTTADDVGKLYDVMLAVLGRIKAAAPQEATA